MCDQGRVVWGVGMVRGQGVGEGVVQDTGGGEAVAGGFQLHVWDCLRHRNLAQLSLEQRVLLGLLIQLAFEAVVSSLQPHHFAVGALQQLHLE